MQAEAAAGQPPATRSIIEGMLLPDTTAFATEFMARSWGYNQGSSPENADEVMFVGPTVLRHLHWCAQRQEW